MKQHLRQFIGTRGEWQEIKDDLMWELFTMEHLQDGVRRFWNGVNLIGLILHELAHAAMTVLLFPFGAQFSGLKIIAGLGNGKLVGEGKVYHGSTNRLIIFLISAAPMILLYIMVLAFDQVWMLFFFSQMMLSKQDIDVCDRALRGKPQIRIDGQQLCDHLNSCFTQNTKPLQKYLSGENRTIEKEK